MEGEHKKGLNVAMIENDLQNCCKSEEQCGQCRGKQCIIGFAKQCIQDFKREPKKEVPGGLSQVPTMDARLFDEVELEVATAHILKECKECKEDHTDDCIINVLRHCYEVGLFGDVQPFEGSVFPYLMQLQKSFPQKADQIAAVYSSIRLDVSVNL